jgi:translocator protein
LRRRRVFHGNSPHRHPPLTPYLALVGFIGLCLLVGAAGGALTAAAIRTWYLTLTPPPLTPPNWLFAPVWTTLYVMIGGAGWLVWRRHGAGPAIRLWGWQLAANAVWTPAFFGLHSPGLGLAVILVLLGLIGATIRRFWRDHRLAAALMMPYCAWTVFATYLNAGFWWLNGG